MIENVSAYKSHWLDFEADKPGMNAELRVTMTEF